MKLSLPQKVIQKNRCKDSYHRAFVGTWYVESGDIGYYADSKGNADGNAKQTAGTKAFVDAHTGLPNKNACNELLNKKDIITDSTACIMFDLNNLKTVNDTMGHSAGDQLILNFAKLLCSVIPEKDFVGRYGGDEFIAVIYHTSEAEIKEILKSLSREKERLNSCENQLPIDYACGWALSSDDMACTMQMLLDDADAYMYKNKQLCKKYN